MDCRELTTALACYTNAAGDAETVVAHYEYGKNATGGTIITAIRYTDADGTPIDVTGGTVVAGACVAPVIPDTFPDQTHVIVNGSNTAVPAGMKSVTINNISGVTTVNGGFQLGNGRRVDAISYDATTSDDARGLLPAIPVSGGTWQWTALRPIAEV